jgi:hypothetical protein
MKTAAYIPKTAFAMQREDFIKATAYMNGSLLILAGHGDEKEVSQKVH